MPTLPCTVLLPKTAGAQWPCQWQTGATCCSTVVGWAMTWPWPCTAVVLLGLYCFANKAEYISFVSGLEYVPISHFCFLEKGLGSNVAFNLYDPGQIISFRHWLLHMWHEDCERTGHPKGFRVCQHPCDSVPGSITGVVGLITLCSLPCLIIHPNDKSRVASTRSLEGGKWHW